jgi:hypothetical protein
MVEPDRARVRQKSCPPPAVEWAAAGADAVGFAALTVHQRPGLGLDRARRLAADERLALIPVLAALVGMRIASSNLFALPPTSRQRAMAVSWEQSRIQQARLAAYWLLS